MNKRNFNHHSTADWDFQSSKWVLSNDKFISPPSSLHPTDDPYMSVLCNAPPTLLLPEARLVSGFYVTWWAARFGFTFRNQAPLGSANHDNCYWIWRYFDLIFFYRMNAGIRTNLGNWPDPFPMNEWYHLRATFWNGEDEGGNPALAVQVEYRSNGIWHDLGTLYDTANHWKNSGINRVGLIFMYDISFCDDTEIWVKA